MSGYIARMKSLIDEPPSPSNPDSEDRRKKRHSKDVKNPEPRPRRDNPSPELPHDPQDVPEQELRPPA